MLTDGLHPVPRGKLAAIVTYLERTTPPGALPELPAGVTITLAPRPSAAWYRALFRRVGEEWLWCDRLRLTDAGLQNLLERPEHRLLVMARDGEEIGFAELEPPQRGSVEIIYFGLVGPATGAGLGAGLMEAALATAFASGAARVWLHTCTHDDPRALGFYARIGFRAYATDVEVGEDPRLSGLLRRGAAPHAPIVDQND